MSTQLATRLVRLEQALPPAAVQVFAYGRGSKEDLDHLLNEAPGLAGDAITSVVWFQWGSPLRIEWGPAGRSWGDARCWWPAH